MTATIDAPAARPPEVDAALRVERSHYTKPVSLGEEKRCGGGMPQPGWPACSRMGRWRVRQRSRDEWYEHGYCTEHAHARLDAGQRLQDMQRAAKAERWEAAR